MLSLLSALLAERGLLVPQLGGDGSTGEGILSLPSDMSRYNQPSRAEHYRDWRKRHCASFRVTPGRDLKAAPLGESSCRLICLHAHPWLFGILTRSCHTTSQPFEICLVATGTMVLSLVSPSPAHVAAAHSGQQMGCRLHCRHIHMRSMASKGTPVSSD